MGGSGDISPKDFRLSQDFHLSKHGANLIVDGFYEFPDLVREAALREGFEYRSDAVTYPGAEGHIATPAWLEIHGQVAQKLIHAHMQEGEPPPHASTQRKTFLQGKFRVATARDEFYRPDGVHQDFQRWSGIVYLTLPEHCRGGLGFYAHRQTGARHSSDPRYGEFVKNMLSSVPAELRDYAIHAHMRDMSNWTLIDEIPLVYNRLVIAMAHCFHATGVCFGDNLRSARLSQHFEFYEYEPTAA